MKQKEAALKTLRRLADVFKMACDWDALEALEAAIKTMEDASRRFTPEEVADRMTDAAWSGYGNLEIGDVIRYTPSQVMEILKKAGE